MRISRYVLLALVLALGSQAFGQIDRVVMNRPRNENRPVRFGISVGMNVMDFRVTNTGSISTVNEQGDSARYFVTTDKIYPGFTINALIRFRITEDFHFRMLPGICFGQRDLVFYDALEGSPTQGGRNTTMKLETAYIDMPMLFVYQAIRFDNARPYILAGLNVRTDLAAYKKLKIEKGQLLRLQKFDLAYEVGFGFEFYFPLFKFAPEIKWSGGVLNAISDSYAEGAGHYRNAIKSLRTQAVMLSFIFE